MADGSVLKADEIALTKFKLNHGLGERHPLKHVKFYDSKGDASQAYYLSENKLQSMIPKEIVMWKVRCFVKPYEKLERPKFEQALNAFEKYCKSELGGVPHQVQKDEILSQMNQS